MTMERTSDNVLRLYSEDLDQWRKALYGSDIERFFNSGVPPFNLEIAKAMTEKSSTLFMDISNEMDERGAERVLRRLKTAYLDNFLFLKSKSHEIDEVECEDLFKLLKVGNTFLQICADKAMEMGGDPAAIKNVVGVFPRGAGGMSLTENYIIKPHTQAKAAQPCSPAFLCNGQEQQKEPQGGGKGAGLAVVPNEHQQAAEGQEMGSNEPQPIPKELDNDEAKTYFKKAVELGLMTDDFRWLKGFQMLACFAREMSRKLDLGKGERLSWKPFETLFGVPKGKLRLNLNDIQNKGQEPKEAYLIDKIFE